MFNRFRPHAMHIVNYKCVSRGRGSEVRVLNEAVKRKGQSLVLGRLTRVDARQLRRRGSGVSWGSKNIPNRLIV